MPSPTTAIDLITRSMKLAKILAVGETPTADEAEDALATLNDILENWDTESLSLWSTSNFTAPTVAGQATYTIGPGGDFNTTRPADISGAFVTLSGVDFPVGVVGQLEFNLIAQKALQQPLPQKLVYLNDHPLGLITLWPVPSQQVNLTLTFDRLLTQIPDTATAINYPPGAAKALRYTLALELAIEYGVSVDPGLVALAADAKGDYKSSNRQPVKARYDAALVSRGGFVNWRTGV